MARADFGGNDENPGSAGLMVGVRLVLLGRCRHYGHCCATTSADECVEDGQHPAFGYRCDAEETGA
jgi:hypothetical protein